MPVPDLDDPMLNALDPGERSAIALGLSLKADLILIDERKGAAVALNKGFEVAGTLGVLDRAAARGLVNLRDALDRLKRTNFRYRPELIAALLKKHEDEGDHKLRLNFVDADGRAIMPSVDIPVQVVLPGDSLFGTRNFIVNIQQLKFENPGLYSIDVRLDDQSQTNVPLLVKHNPPAA